MDLIKNMRGDLLPTLDTTNIYSNYEEIHQTHMGRLRSPIDINKEK